jgi:phosphate transport system permease protein
MQKDGKGLSMKKRIVSAKDLAFKPNLKEKIIRSLLIISAVISVLVTIGIVFELGKESLLFFNDPEVSLSEFFTTTTWQPAIGKFGIWPLISATVLTSIIAMTIALPLGLFVAIYLSEYASYKVRSFLKPILELLAGIPTIVYGFFALTFITPVLSNIFGEQIGVYNMLSAGIAMGILITPLISTMTEDALGAHPQSLRDAAYGVGATKLETTIHIVLPAAFSGVAAGFIVGFSRAIGETMIVAVASGAGPNFTFNPLKAAETLTGYMVRISGGDVSYGTLDYTSIFAIGLLLFFITLGLNILSRKIIKKFREVYE